MDPIIVSVVLRYMKRCPAFVQNAASKSAPAELTLEPDERLIGWYCNPPPWERTIIVFSTRAIYSLEDQAVEETNWSEVTGYESPNSKADIQGVTVHTALGPRFIRMAGSHGSEGRFKDALGLVQILHVWTRPASS